MIQDFVLVSDYSEIEKRYGVKNFYPGLKIPVPKVLSAKDEFWIITLDTPGYMSKIPFGYTQEFLRQFEFTFNIYINDPYEYFINSRLVTKSSPKRCLAIVDAFLIQTPKGKYLVHLQNKQRAFGLAATYKYWINNSSGVSYVGFAIFTVPSSPMFQRIGVAELPVVVTNENAQFWIGKDFNPNDIVKLFNSNNDDLLNGYPIRNDISSGPVSWNHLQPKGNRLKPIKQNSSGTKLNVIKKEHHESDLNRRKSDNVLYLK